MLNDHTTNLEWLRLLNLLTFQHLYISAESVEHSLTVSLATEQKEEEKRQLNVTVHELNESAAGLPEKVMILRDVNLFFRHIWESQCPLQMLAA